MNVRMRANKDPEEEEGATATSSTIDDEDDRRAAVPRWCWSTATSIQRRLGNLRKKRLVQPRWVFWALLLLVQTTLLLIHMCREAVYSGGAAICVIQKGGEPYLDEFVDYHLALGFEKIFIFDNSDDFELEQWHHGGSRVAVEHFPGEAMQLPAYRTCGVRIKKKRSFAWIAFIDVDEFIVLKKHNHILDLLETVDSEAGGLAINWYMFDYYNQTEYKPLPLTKRFQQRHAAVDQHVKTIARTSKYSGYHQNPHSVFYLIGAYPVDTDGTVLVEHPWWNPDGPTDTAVIHHYHAKSLEEFISRCARGRASITMKKAMEKSKNYLWCKNETEILEAWNKAKETIFDDTVWQILKERVPEYVDYDLSP